MCKIPTQQGDAGRAASADDAGYGQGDAWTGIDVETVMVVGAAGVGQVVKSDDIVTIGGDTAASSLFAACAASP